MTIQILVFTLFSITSSASFSQNDYEKFELEAPSGLSSLHRINVWATEYYVHETSSEGSIPYLTTTGDTLGYFSDTCDFCTACLEGTVFIESDYSDRVVLNYAGRSKTPIVNCRECAKFKNSSLNVESWGSVRWKKSSGYGEGVKNYKLIPYRTIAVDSKKIPYGSVVFIPDAVGTLISLPDGTIVTHDGYFFAGDTGGAIKQNHIDVFTGNDASHPFNFVKSTSSKTSNCYIVTDKSIISTLTQMHLK